MIACRLAFLLCMISLAAGCQNGTSRGDPFLQRRLVPEPPLGSYSAPPPGAGYYPQNVPPVGAGAAVPLGAGAIIPASGASGQSRDGWVAADDEPGRRVSLEETPSAGALAADAGGPEPGRFEPAADARELSVEGGSGVDDAAASTVSADDPPASEPAETAQFAEPSKSRPARPETAELQWSAPRR